MPMQPTLIIALLSALFVATHIGMASARTRAWMVSQLGENRFVALYSAVASAQFGLLIAYYAAHRFDGAAGLGLGATPAIRWALIAVIAVGITLMGGSLAGYLDSPFSALAHNFREPYGIERITRHGLFTGTFMLGAAHALLASHLNGTIVFSSLAVLAVAGARHQDGKLLQRGGEAYRHYLETTSMVPFAAIVSGRQRIAWHELPVRGLTIAFAVAVTLRLVHDWIFAYGGLLVIAAVVGGPGILAFVSSLRRRSQSHDTPLSDTRPAVDGGRFMRST
jgi:uncharacterized membrane protein